MEEPRVLVVFGAFSRKSKSSQMPKWENVCFLVCYVCCATAQAKWFVAAMTEKKRSELCFWMLPSGFELWQFFFKSANSKVNQDEWKSGWSCVAKDFLAARCWLFDAAGFDSVAPFYCLAKWFVVCWLCWQGLEMMKNRDEQNCHGWQGKIWSWTGKWWSSPVIKQGKVGLFWYCGQGLDRKCTSKVSWSECERASVCSWFFCCLTGFSELGQSKIQMQVARCDLGGCLMAPQCDRTWMENPASSQAMLSYLVFFWKLSWKVQGEVLENEWRVFWYAGCFS